MIILIRRVQFCSMLERLLSAPDAREKPKQTQNQKKNASILVVGKHGKPLKRKRERRKKKPVLQQPKSGQPQHCVQRAINIYLGAWAQKLARPSTQPNRRSRVSSFARKVFRAINQAKRAREKSNRSKETHKIKLEIKLQAAPYRKEEEREPGRKTFSMPF